MITSQPALWDAIPPILNNVAVIANEQESATLWQIDLHANQAISVAGQMV